MKMKIGKVLTTVALGALFLGACSSDDENVQPVPQLQITNAADQVLKVEPGDEFKMDLGLQNETDRVTWSADTLPAGLSINSKTGEITGNFAELPSRLYSVFSNIKVVADDDTTNANSSIVNWHLLNLAEGEPILSVNAGGKESFTNDFGETFEADKYFTDGIVHTWFEDQEIMNTPQREIFVTERYGEEFSYDFDVENGKYIVELHFSENRWDGGAFRRFHIDIEGQTVEEALDIWKEANALNSTGTGKFFAINKEYQTTVVDGQLNIRFYLSTLGRDFPKVSGISIRKFNE